VKKRRREKMWGEPGKKNIKEKEKIQINVRETPFYP